MSEEQEVTATAEATAEQAETQESQTTSEAGESKEAQVQDQSSYEAYTLPDGFQMEESFKNRLDGLFKEANLDQAMAQKFVDEHTGLMAQQFEAGKENREAQQQEWAAESRVDKEFGGANFAENLVGARKTMNSFSNPAVNKDGKAVLHSEGPMKGQQMTEMEVLMNESGWGNAPAMIRFLHRVTQATSNDSFVQGDMKPMEKKKTHADIMYGGSHPA
jgi:hypothetical protein